MSDQVLTVSEATARRIVEALEEQTEMLRHLVAATEAKATDEEPPVFPLGPILPKNRPRAGRGR